jgi:hypothetical protein
MKLRCPLCGDPLPHDPMPKITSLRALGTAREWLIDVAGMLLLAAILHFLLRTL